MSAAGSETPPSSPPSVVGAAVRRGIVTRAEAVAAFRAEGCSSPRDWGNAPGHRYGRHDHDFHKVLFCLEGSLVFHTDDGDLELFAGDRLDLERGTAHAATVGPDGCRCVEASR
jgi:hypothetical protein